MATAPDLRAELAKAIDESNQVVVDLTALNSLDSSGIATLLGARQRAEEVGTAIELLCPTEQCQKVLNLTGVDRLFTIRHA
jgi:anti-sigma B factor antagonist